MAILLEQKNSSKNDIMFISAAVTAAATAAFTAVIIVTSDGSYDWRLNVPQLNANSPHVFQNGSLRVFLVGVFILQLARGSFFGGILFVFLGGMICFRLKKWQDVIKIKLFSLKNSQDEIEKVTWNQPLKHLTIQEKKMAL
ncbi:hypothetical protein BCR33DRAFT_819246 [Rhizoclosmatium globosum]|uniref:Transmembrane protein n=1 Tax=Rhizoclosmatium globosum TaxID=329046 RepID=A0A1Y2C9R8_9FUNG|nr:hypothetical protein BCR33DRAFT_819246 [Rhizoclosmatium globosum]|eukprot:ORY43780.1 hypothetical protein BCR33DRAFT_819246 [Rhizoclosmatium globosum]